MLSEAEAARLTEPDMVPADGAVIETEGAMVSAEDPPPVPAYSYAPISQAEPCGRDTPSLSTVKYEASDAPAFTRGEELSGAYDELSAGSADTSCSWQPQDCLKFGYERMLPAYCTSVRKLAELAYMEL